MIAFDTNLLVRLVVNDDEQQAAIAEQLLTENEVLVSRTVLLETEWVLRSVYKQPRETIAAFMAVLMQTKNVVVENAVEVEQALDWYQAGSDFADALHLCVCGQAEMHTFDVKFCKAARNNEAVPSIHILSA